MFMLDFDVEVELDEALKHFPVHEHNAIKKQFSETDERARIFRHKQSSLLCFGRLRVSYNKKHISNHTNRFVAYEIEKLFWLEFNSIFYLYPFMPMNVVYDKHHTDYIFLLYGFDFRKNKSVINQITLKFLKKLKQEIEIKIMPEFIRF